MPSGKTYRAVKEKAPKEAVNLAAAIKFLQANARKSFAETIELHIKLGVNPEKSDQMVRGSVTLPHGTPKQPAIAVITDDADKQTAAKKAGATIVGGEDIIADIEKNGKIAANLVIATPNMMPKIAKVAKILGPKGLMPNPKTGTVTDDPAAAVAELAAGKVSFKMDSTGNIHEAVAKASWEADKIEANTTALLEAIRPLRPASAKGEFFKSITLCSSMSPGIRITTAS